MVDRSMPTPNSIAEGSWALSCGRTVLMLLIVSIMLAPGWRKIKTLIEGRPSAMA